ncbi:MAG: metalloregulator ArsR/SmtB family transcription factor [Candidatus Odinarchaeum yellowstonii]|uniref:Metalloregulator ArsR/SmtB family transcription factor n=1 Tax=Odinarchaeota yellowstonii (strain LCB_4) TaxID=1841599 RepID=A0AAF0D231_ODILC|nr:MAG: metalloregulator ArsR/SmtB family transcription factor [Candidatus Odinarchaeum yellowstonii]
MDLKLECSKSRKQPPHSIENQNKSDRCNSIKKLAEKILDQQKISTQLKVFKALSDETRLKILLLLRVKSLCVCELMEVLNLTQPTASHHIQILENAGLIREEKKGKWRFFHIVDSSLVDRLLELVF